MDNLINERKYAAHSLDWDRAVTLVEHVCSPHIQFHKGTVNSIYFDTPNLACYKEKIEGDTQKRKYRLRWYNVETQDPKAEVSVFVEIKYRYGSARDKIRRKINLPLSELVNRHLEESYFPNLLRQAARDVPDNIPVHLEPVVCITYERFRFECPMTGASVCIDGNIRAGRANARIFPLPVPVDLNVVLCEIKHPGLVEPEWMHALYHAGFRIRSFSKYGEIVNNLLLAGAPTVIRMSI